MGKKVVLQTLLEEGTTYLNLHTHNQIDGNKRDPQEMCNIYRLTELNAGYQVQERKSLHIKSDMAS